MANSLRLGSLRSAAAPLHALWRRPDLAAIIGASTSLASVLTELRGACCAARPAALAVVRALDDVDVGLAGVASATQRWRSRAVEDCLATDLLGGALLMEALRGDGSAQLAVDHMRGQSGHTAVPWATLACAPQVATGDDLDHDLGVCGAPA